MSNDYQTPMLKLFSEELEGAKEEGNQLVVEGKTISVRGTKKGDVVNPRGGDYYLYMKNELDVFNAQFIEKNKEYLRGDNSEYYFGTKESVKKEEYTYTYKEVIEKIRGELGMSTAKEKLKELINAGEKQVVLTGAPGTGKTYTAKKFAKESAKKNKDNTGKAIEESKIEEFIEFVQFHSSYDYTDFVEGLRPVNINGVMTFVRLDGIFKKFCRKIVKENKKNGEENKKIKKGKYFFIIDEINRADLSKVFGELMYGLEEGYRGKENSFQTQYMNLPTYEINEIDKNAEDSKKASIIADDCFKKGFYIPENLIIIGTMNDIDRSVETFDFALRRRFVWVDVKVEYELGTALEGMFNEENNKDEPKKEISEEEISEEEISEEERIKAEEAEAEKKRCLEHLKKGIIEMNKLISGDEGKKLFLNESFHIGHAYFKNYDVKEPEKSIERIWEYRVKPLLEEYCRGKDAGTFINLCKEKLISEINKCENKPEKISNTKDGDE